jgi:hypothetical protein
VTTLEKLHQMLEPSNRLDHKANQVVGRSAYLVHVPQVVCADGFRMSVQASELHYCIPRDSIGPYSAVEVGYPSERVEAFMPYIDGADSEATNTVYGYVPLSIVADAIDAHGGLAK